MAGSTHPLKGFGAAQGSAVEGAQHVAMVNSLMNLKSAAVTLRSACKPGNQALGLCE